MSTKIRGLIEAFLGFGCCLIPRSWARAAFSSMRTPIWISFCRVDMSFKGNFQDMSNSGAPNARRKLADPIQHTQT